MYSINKPISEEFGDNSSRQGMLRFSGGLKKLFDIVFYAAISSIYFHKKIYIKKSFLSDKCILEFQLENYY